jgi:hypothetical protein
MSVIVSHAQIQRVKDALALVASNGQAVAACDAATKAAKSLAGHLRSVGGAIREGAAKDLEEYAKRVEGPRKALNGSPNAAVALASWAKAKEQVFNLYMLAFTIESTMPQGSDFGDGWGNALSYAVDELPATIGKAVAVATKVVVKTVKVASKVAGEITKEVAKASGGVVWGFVAGAWPLLLIASVGVVAYFTLKGKLSKAVSL